MTRKDYILIARELSHSYRCAGVSTPATEAIMHVARNIAHQLKDDNPRFDFHHFLAVVRGEKALESRPARKVRVAESAASEQEKILVRTGGNVEIVSD